MNGTVPAVPFSDDTGLKAYWKFNETSGNIINVSESAADLGSAADITVTGATYNQSMDPFGYSLQFDGVNDEVKCGSSTSQWNFMHNTTFEFSLCWWQIRSAWDSTQEALWGNCDEWASAETGFSCRYPTTDGRLDFNWSNGTNMNRWRPTQTGFTQDANPHFICITADYADATNNLEV
jgi:hypothetical protein